MADKAKPDIPLILGGKKRSIRFDLNAMCAFEGATGQNVFDGTFSGANLSATNIRAMLWACLSHDSDTLTIEQVGAWIGPQNMAEVARKLRQAFTVAMPESAGEPAPLAARPRPG